MNEGPASSGPRGRVVAGVDGTPNSLAALRRAVYQARHREAGLEIVYVIPAGANEAAEASGYEMLDIALRHVAPEGPGQPAGRIVARGEPGEVLARLSAGAGLLVIGARIHSEYGNLLGGDVVPYCLARASCPVDICADQRASAAPQAAARPAAACVAAARSATAHRAPARSAAAARLERNRE
jgi:nucleotide-binding universal stress UspA family protein